jgi:hypothetical protein
MFADGLAGIAFGWGVRQSFPDLSHLKAFVRSTILLKE